MNYKIVKTVTETLRLERISNDATVFEIVLELNDLGLDIKNYQFSAAGKDWLEVQVTRHEYYDQSTVKRMIELLKWPLGPI